MNSFNLKLLAVITMLIDHVGIVFMQGSPYYRLFRIIGRLAFPIFCFLLVEGYFHTRDVRKYLLRLGLFALLSEIPFDLVLSRTIWEPDSQNVYFTLLLGLSLIWAVDTAKKRFTPTLSLICSLCAFFLAFSIALFLHADYDVGGVLLIYIFYLFRENKIILFTAVFTELILLFGGIEAFGALAMIFILLYNGEKGKSMKYIFYAFYPVHLLLLTLIHHFFF